MRNLGETAVNACYSGFGKHCVEVHRPMEDDLADSRMCLDLNDWTLTPLK